MKKFGRYLIKFVVLGLMIWGTWHLNSCMEIDSCLDLGDVWDYNEKRCRKDCLTWNKLHGCIYMNEEYQRLFLACAEKTEECSDKRLEELHIEACKKYNGALNLEYGYCDFEFTPDQCFKLEGKWKYPDVCDKTRAGNSEVR